MKRNWIRGLLIVSLLLIVIGGMGISVFASDIVESGSCGENVTWQLDSDGVLTISGSGKMGNYSSNAVPWYSIRDQVIEVAISDSVTSIGNSAFYDCSGLTEITIPDSVTRIGDSAFSGCGSLISITIPESVTIIEDSTFSGCSNLKYIAIPDSVTSIGACAFSACSSLTNITIPEVITNISDYTFSGCSNLTNITIPDGVISIGQCAFSDCSSLSEITIPQNVSDMGFRMLSGCSSLEIISIPFCKPLSFLFGSYYSDSYYDDSFLGTAEKYVPDTPASLKTVIVTGGESIPDSAFMGCRSLINVILPDSINYIGYRVFYDCRGLTSIAIPEGVETIYTATFRDCINITSVFLPNSLKYIQNMSFYGCISLANITLPEGVKNINSQAFYGCSSLTEIILPESVTSIANQAFYGCSSLTEIILPESVTSIAYRAFYGCSSLTEIILPESVTSIANQAFYECSSLKSITLPQSVTSIGQSILYGCYNLETVTIPFVGANVTSDKDHVERYPFGYLFGSVDYSNSYEVNQYYYYKGDKTGKYYIPEKLQNVTVTGGYLLSGAFSECRDMTISIDTGVLGISSPFRDCNNINVVLKDGIESICDHAFSNCSGIASISIPDSVTSIGEYAFSNCLWLTEFTIPNNILSIGRDAFVYCYNLSSVTFQNGLENIEAYAFYYCESLHEIFIPGSVKSIGDYAFWGCSDLTYVEFEADAPDVAGEHIFYQMGNGNNLISVSSKSSGWTFPKWKGYNIAYRDVAPDDNKLLSTDDYNKLGLKFELNETDFTAIVSGFTANIYGEARIPGKVTKDGSRYTVTSIGANAFSSNTNLKSVVIGQYVETIDSTAFYGCTNLDTITVDPNSNLLVAENSVVYNKNKTRLIRAAQSILEIQIPYGVTHIQARAFDGCNNLKNVTIPDSVTNIGQAIFLGCSALDTLTLPFVGDQIRTQNDDYQYPIGYLFSSAYTSYSVYDAPEGYSTVEQYYYYYGNNSRSYFYYIPNSLKSVTVTGGSILYGAFYNCSMIEEITLGRNVIFTGERAFYGCRNLKKFNVDRNNANLTADASGVLYSKDMKTVKCYPAGRSNPMYMIDERATAIEPFAFYNCLDLESLYVPDSVVNMPVNSIAYYDLTMFVNRGSTAEQYAKDEEIEYRYIGEGTPDNIRIASGESGLPLLAVGSESSSVIGDYDGMPFTVSDCVVEYDSSHSGIQTVSITHNGETTQTEALVYNPGTEAVVDFGEMLIEEGNIGLAGVFDESGHFMGLCEVLLFKGHVLSLVTGEAFDEGYEIKLFVVNGESFVPAMDSVNQGL